MTQAQVDKKRRKKVKAFLSLRENKVGNFVRISRKDCLEIIDRYSKSYNWSLYYNQNIYLNVDALVYYSQHDGQYTVENLDQFIKDHNSFSTHAKNAKKIDAVFLVGESQLIESPIKRKKTNAEIMAIHTPLSNFVGSQWEFKSLIQITVGEYEKLARDPDSSLYNSGKKIYIKDEEIKRLGYVCEYRLENLLLFLEHYMKTHNDRILGLNSHCFVFSKVVITLDQYMKTYHGMTFEELTSCF